MEHIMKSYSISDQQGTQVTILPGKGATAVSLTRDGVEFLYRNESNLASAERPRCGIPFLFPIFGRLDNGQYVYEGKSFSMDIHGFGRTSGWNIVTHSTDMLCLSLEANEETLRQYPFLFWIELCYRVENGTLLIHQRYENLGKKPMPYNFGFHPYFRVDGLEDAQIEITSDNHFDSESGRAVPFGYGRVSVSIPEGRTETGDAFMGVSSPAVLSLPREGRKITMEFDDNFPQLLLWTQVKKPFLCMEPINGTPNGLNTGMYFILQPGERREAVVKIHAEFLTQNPA